jgi:hypothetical protein
LKHIEFMQPLYCFIIYVLNKYSYLLLFYSFIYIIIYVVYYLLFILLLFQRGKEREGGKNIKNTAINKYYIMSRFKKSY